MNNSVCPSELTQAINSYLIRKVKLLFALISAITAGGVWLVQTLVDWKAEKVAQKEIETFKLVMLTKVKDAEDKITKTNEEGQRQIGKVEKQLEDLEEVAKKVGDIEAKHQTLVELAPLVAQIKEAASEVEGVSKSAAEIEAIRKKLVAAKDISSSERNVSAIADLLANKPEFKAIFDTRMQNIELLVKGQTDHLAELQKRLAAVDSALEKLSAMDLAAGIPYRVLGNTKDKQVEIHTGPIGNHDTGQIHYDPSSPKAQFYRLSSAVIHDQRTPRCLARFKGWLPERAFPDAGKSAENSLRSQVEILKDTPLMDRKLRESASGDSRELAEFEGGTVFFTTGQSKDGWLEVTCDGWVSLIYFKDQEPMFLAAPVE